MRSALVAGSSVPARGLSMRHLKDLVREIHQRSLWQVMAIYLGACWAALEVVDVLTDTAGLPPWVPALALAGLVVTFPAVVATAWVRDVSDEHGPASHAPCPPTEANREAGDRDESAERPDSRAILVAFLGIAMLLPVLGFATARVLGGSTAATPPESVSSSPTPPTTDRTVPSVAVLPFANRSPDPADAFLADGVHESVVAALSRIASLDVRSERSVARFRETDRPLDEIAAELHVGSIVEGSVHRSGDRIRIMTHLVDPATGVPRWTETYDRRLDDIFEVESDVARRVASALEATLTPREIERLEQTPTTDVGAYELYLRGREAYLRLDAESNREAIRLYRSALARDPRFAAAWAGIGDAFLQGTQFFGAPAEWADSGRVAAENAVRLDPDLPEGYKTLAFTHWYGHRHRQALDLNLRAVQLAPGFADAVNNVGFAYYFLGDIPNAIRWVDRALRLQPNVVLLHSNAGALRVVVGDLETALPYIDEARELDPGNPAAMNWRFVAELYRGRPDSGVALARRFLDDNPTALSHARLALAELLAGEPGPAASEAALAMEVAPGSTLMETYEIDNVRGAALTALGRSEEARPFLEAVVARAEARIAGGADGWQDRWAMATASASLGRADALGRLEEAVEGGFFFYPLMELSPAFDGVRNDRRFRGLVERVRERVARQGREIRADAVVPARVP